MSFFIKFINNLFLSFYESEAAKNYIRELLKCLSIDYFYERFKQFSSYRTSFFEILNHFSSSFLMPDLLSVIRKTSFLTT